MIKRDYKFLIYTIFQFVNGVLLLFAVIGIIFWRGDNQVRTALEKYEVRSNCILTNSINVVSNAYLLLTVELEEIKRNVSSTYRPLTNSLRSVSRDEERRQERRLNQFSPHKISIAVYDGITYCRINDLEHYFTVGDYWLDSSRIVAITDYYVQTENDIYFITSKLKGSTDDGYTKPNI